VPGTARSSTSAGRLLINTSAVTKFFPRPNSMGHGMPHSALTTNGQTRAPVARSLTDLAVRAYVSNIGGQ
jgi:hypothetical protein